MQVPTQSCRPVPRNKCSQVPKTKCSYGKWSATTKRQYYFSGLLRRILVSSDFGYQHETAAFFLNIHCFNWIKFGGRTFQPLLRILLFYSLFWLRPGARPPLFSYPWFTIYCEKKILWGGRSFLKSLKQIQLFFLLADLPLPLSLRRFIVSYCKALKIYNLASRGWRPWFFQADREPHLPESSKVKFLCPDKWHMPF